MKIILLVLLFSPTAFSEVISVNANDIKIAFEILNKTNGPEPVVIIDGLIIGSINPSQRILHIPMVSLERMFKS